LDESVDLILKTGAAPLMCITFKPRVLFPKIDQDIVEPSSYEEWDALIYELVRHYRQRGSAIRYWEVANEPDIVLSAHGRRYPPCRSERARRRSGAGQSQFADLAGSDHRAVFTALQRRFPRGEVQAGLFQFLVMAGQTVLLQDRLDGVAEQSGAVWAHVVAAQKRNVMVALRGIPFSKC
jgi:hypothetical protein